MDAITRIPQPVNEPVHDYAPGSPERERLVTQLDLLANNPLDIHQVIGGEHRTAAGPTHEVVQPHNHASAIGSYRKATNADIADAIEASQQAAQTWRSSPSSSAPASSSAPPTCCRARGERLAAATMLGSPRPPTRPRSTPL